MSRTSPPTPAQAGVAALLAVAYVAASSWLIRGEGEAYRKALRAERSALAARLDPEPAKADPIAPPSPTPAPPASPSPAPPEVVEPSPAPPKVVESPPVSPKVAEPSPAPPEPARPDPPPPVVPSPAPPPAVHPAPRLAALDPFWEEPDQKKVWDLDHFTIEDERQLGATLHRMVLHEQKPLKVGPLPARVEAAAEPFLKALTRKGLDYTFTVLDCDESNAFSLPGGYVYFCRGIFDWIPEEDDDALGFLVGHEIAHVDLGHAVACLRDPEVKKLKVGTVPLFASLVIPMGYKTNQMDFEADRWAWQHMSQADRSSRRASLSFLRKLENFARKNGFENVREAPSPEGHIAPLDNHLRAHPIPRSRIKALLEVMDPKPKSS